MRAAFLYGYSADEAYKYFHATVVAKGESVNTLERLPDIPDDTYTDHPTINIDTLHIMGWLDVAAEPMIFDVPDHDAGRYWLLHAMDMGHCTIAMIGSRTRGATGGRFMIAAERWSGDVPDGIDDVIRSATDFVKVMPRIMATDEPSDLALARDLQARWQLLSLSEFLGNEPLPAVERAYPDPADTNWVEQVNFVLAHGSLASVDQNWIESSRAIGIEPATRDFTPEQLNAIDRGERLGMELIERTAPGAKDARKLLGTRAQLQDGDRLWFSEGTYLGQWGLPVEESMYFQVRYGTDGEPATGADGRRYRIVMPDPDVECFWSWTAYRVDNRLMDSNELGRHSRGDRTMVPNADGSYVLELASDGAGRADDPNFLPIPDAEFYLILRLYGPNEATIRGDYEVPELELVASGGLRRSG